MTKLSYRDVLSQVFDDTELVEALCDFISRYKEFGAFRGPILPSHVLVTLIDRIKTLSEQQIEFYKGNDQDKAYDAAVETDELEQRGGEARSATDPLEETLRAAEAE